MRNEDQDDVGRIYRNQEVRRFLGGSLDHENFKRHLVSLLSESTAVNWTVRLKSTFSFIGMVSIGKHQDGQEEEISYQFLPEFWGKGYACEVVSAILRYAADVMGISSIVAETQDANHASRRLLERVGMEPVRTLERFGAAQILYRRTLLP